MLVKADSSHAESCYHSTATVLLIALKDQASSHGEEEGMGQGQGHSGARKSCPKGKLPNPDRMEKGNGGANTHWWVENRLQLCHKVIMAIKFCKNTKFLFGTFMNIQYLIFSPILGFLFLTGIKEKKKMYLVSYSPSIVQTSPNPFQYTLIPCKYYYIFYIVRWKNLESIGLEAVHQSSWRWKIQWRNRGDCRHSFIY